MANDKQPKRTDIDKYPDAIVNFITKLEDKLHEEKFASTTFKYRGAIWTILFILMLAFARPTIFSVLIGLLFIIAGQALRYLAVGCIGKYRGIKVGADRLTTWGPYAIVRNPLYVANFLIGFGTAWMTDRLWIGVVFVITFIIVYGFIIVPHEEKYLSQKFGKEYHDYRQRVGAFFPKHLNQLKSSNWKLPQDITFNKEVLTKSETYSLIMTLIMTVIIISRLWW